MIKVDKEFLDDYNWAEVFGETGNGGYCHNQLEVEPTIHNPKVSLKKFTRKDVKKIIGIVEGENEGDHWEIVCKLKDGRFAYLNGWCDYTGWDCQSATFCFVANKLDHLNYVINNYNGLGIKKKSVELK